MKKALLLILCFVMLLSTGFISEKAYAAVSGDEFVTFARENCLNIPYKSGGRTTAGFDCCGLVWYVCNHFGIDVGNGNQTSQIKYGSPVSYSMSNYNAFLANLQLGDLIFFDYENDGKSNHVGIYSGNGNIIQAHRTGVNSKEDKLSGGWVKGDDGKYIPEWKLTCAVRRVLSGSSSSQCSHQYETVWENGQYVATRCKHCHTTYDFASTRNSNDAGVYRVTSEYNLNFEPYADAKSGVVKPTGWQFTAINSVTNAYGDKWYETEDHKYVYSVWAEYVSPGESNLTINTPEADYSARTGLPSGSIVGGKSWGLRGTISSNYQLTNVECHIYNSSGVDAVAAYINNNPNTKTYDIKSGGMDKAIPFSGLAVGDYQIVISAWDASMRYVDVVSWFSIVSSTPTVPAKPTVTTSQSFYWAGQSATISWNSVEYNEDFVINVFKDGELIYEADMMLNTSYTLTVQEGEYLVRVSANNSAGTSGSATCSFSVLQAIITYDANGGTGAPTAQAFIPGGGYYFSTVVPTQEGYTFVNWKDDYNGYYYNPGDPIPEAWGSNTLRAQWQVNYYTLDINGYLDGSYSGNLSGYGTVDVYINGSLAAQNVDDYCVSLPYGTSYEIKNICPTIGHQYNGVNYGSLSGYIGENNINIYLSFTSCQYYLDLNGWLDNTQAWDIADYATVDIYINGTLVESSCSDYHEPWPYGTTYEIKNIRPLAGCSFDGFLTDDIVHYNDYSSKGRTGTLTENTSVNPILHTSPTSLTETSEPVIFNNHTYYYFSTPATWYDAKTICENMGGHLVTVSSEEETSFLVNLVGQRSGEEYGCYIWLGATDKDSEGTWRWVTGEEMTYTKWFTDEPDNYPQDPEGAENFAQFYTWQGHWNDYYGCYKMPFVCEVDSANYTILFDPNGGNGTMDDVSATFGVPVTLPECGFTKDDSVFLGWNLRRESDQTWYVWGRSFVSSDTIETEGLVKKLYVPGESVFIGFGDYGNTESYSYVAVWLDLSTFDCALPSSLLTIDDEAFFGCAFRYVRLPDGAESIGRYAFAESEALEYIYIPESVTDIDPDAFDKVEGLTIIGVSGSTAEDFATQYGFSFIEG